MSKLESVASDFRAASHAQMAATTQRTIRENVAVSSQVDVKRRRQDISRVILVILGNCKAAKQDPVYK